MTTLESRLSKLEAKRSGPVRIWVTIEGSGVYRSNGEIVTEAELDERYGDDDVRVILVKYTDKAVEPVAAQNV